MKDLSKHFKNEIKTVSTKNVSAKIKQPHFLPPVFFYLLCVYRGIPFHAILPSLLVSWKNSDQLLLRPSLVNHSTMAVKMWKFLASILHSRSPANIPGTLKVKMMNVLYFFVIHRLNLLQSCRLETIDLKFCNNVIPTLTICLKFSFYRKAKNY